MKIMYLTVLDMRKKFPNTKTGKPKSAKQVCRWGKKGKIITDGRVSYFPEKEPGGGRCWRWKVVVE